jgi:hypothetical protein
MYWCIALFFCCCGLVAMCRPFFRVGLVFPRILLCTFINFIKYKLYIVMRGLCLVEGESG